MKAKLNTLTTAAIVVITLVLGACATTDQMKSPLASTPTPAATASDVSLASVTLGNAIDGGHNVITPTATFAVNDTIYASVATNGSSANSTIAVKWTYQDGQTVNERSESIAPTGPTVTEFHINKPDGWPLGGYSVAIAIDGKLVDAKKFTVK